MKALTFDVFGTVVDWRTSILAELRALGARKNVTVDWEAFLAEWRRAYRPGMDRVNSGEWPWTNVDVIYRRALDLLLGTHGPAGLRETEIDDLNRAWCRLTPWRDSIPGLTRLKTRYVISTLSNANFAWMVQMAKHARLPWDCVITAENARCYKPRPEAYRAAIALLGLRPGEVMMVAAHNDDLRAARAEGMRTAFVPRPMEHGPAQTTDLVAEEAWDVMATDLEDLAGRMRA
ncbi:MAG: haloacid dehalogenase type II [Candidatus Rokuibacteriota bacterium]